MSSGILPTDEAVQDFQNFKTGKDIKFVIFKIEDFKRIVTHKIGGKDETFDDFKEDFFENKAEGRYGVIKMSFILKDGSPREKLVFLCATFDDCCKLKSKMVTASSKDKFLAKLDRQSFGLVREIHDDNDFLEKDIIEELMKKG